MGIGDRLSALRRPRPQPVGERPAPAGWWDLLPFDSHRIEIAPGIWTIDDERTPPVADARTMLVLQCLGGDLGGRSLVDLGCGEGGFTLAFARLGAERTVGVDANPVDVRRADLARSFLDVDHATFVAGDAITELERLGVFDVVFASGVLSELSDPADALAVMRRACSRVALIDTHVAHPDEPSHGCGDPVEHRSGDQSYRGRLRPRPGHPSAFWPMEDDLARMLQGAGFVRVGRIDPEVVTNGREWAVDRLNRVCYLAWV